MTTPIESHLPLNKRHRLVAAAWLGCKSELKQLHAWFRDFPAESERVAARDRRVRILLEVYKNEKTKNEVSQFSNGVCTNGSRNRSVAGSEVEAAAKNLNTARYIKISRRVSAKRAKTFGARRRNKR